jgi:toxin ParE1/3/4
MVEIKWNKSALQDLEEIGEYISLDSVSNAKKYVTTLYEKAGLLQKQPYLGRVVPEFDLQHLRELIFENYRIIYRLNTASIVEVLMIHHASRDITKRSLDK